MPCKLDRYDIKRIETDANSALLILGDIFMARDVAKLQEKTGIKFEEWLTWQGLK